MGKALWKQIEEELGRAPADPPVSPKAAPVDKAASNKAPPASNTASNKKQRWDRAAYNAYMRDYMRRHRGGHRG